MGKYSSLWAGSVGPGLDLHHYSTPLLLGKNSWPITLSPRTSLALMLNLLYCCQAFDVDDYSYFMNNLLHISYEEESYDKNILIHRILCKGVSKMKMFKTFCKSSGRDMALVIFLRLGSVVLWCYSVVNKEKQGIICLLHFHPLPCRHHRSCLA